MQSAIVMQGRFRLPRLTLLALGRGPGQQVRALSGTSLAQRMAVRLSDVWTLSKETAKDWLDDDAPSLAAALAYYALLSLAPLLVISVSIAGWFLGPEAARGQVSGQLSSIVGTEAADGIQSVVASADAPKRGVIGAVVGIITLFVGASGVFGQLQTSLDRIWEVKPKADRGFWVQVKERFFSFTMVLGVAFLLLVSLVLSSLLSSVGQFLADTLPGGAVVWQIVNFSLSFGVVSLLFALIFKVIPDAKVQWRDVWVGAISPSTSSAKSWTKQRNKRQPWPLEELPCSPEAWFC